MSGAVREIDNLTTAQAQRDTLSLIDVSGLGRLKEFQQWAKKTEAFFAGVIKESEMMLEWAAEQTTEIKTTRDRSRVIDDGFERGSRSAQTGVHFAADAYSACGSHESRGERYCCQLAEEPTGGVATTAETI